MKRQVPLMIMVLNLIFIISASAQCNSNDLILKMHDTYGDGWTGNELTIYSLNDDCIKESVAGPFELASGEYGTENICLPDGCYSIMTTAGTFVHEISWELVRASDNAVLSSGQNVDNVYLLSIGATADCSYIGCTDPDSENYDPDATCSFQVCEYSAPVNDEACGAIALHCGISGFYGTTEGATDSGVNACKGYGVEDLWYTILGTGNTIKVTVEGLADTTNMQITVLVSFGGGCDDPMICNSLTSFVKEDVNTKSAQWESDAGATYYINIGSKDEIPNSEYNLSAECLGCDNGITLHADFVGTERALMSWENTTSELTNQEVWICPVGVAAGDASCKHMDNVSSPLTIENLKACTEYDVYLEQTCVSGAEVMTGPMAIEMEEHDYNPEPNVGEQVCYPPCQNGVTTYASNEEIVWTLCTEEGMMPAVTFDYVDIESNTMCTEDRIEVIGSDYTIFLCGESQGDMDFGNGLADGNCYFANQNGGCITLMFKSSESIEETGFCFHFEQIPMAADTDCTDFGLANFSVPVKLLSFDAVAESDYNQINWVTEREINTQWQIIETSTDGSTWSQLDKIQARGGSGNTQYQTVDRNPSTMTYYRLVTIDYDGYTERFNTVVVRRDKVVQKLSITSILPNPAYDNVSVTLSSKTDELIEVQVIDLNGKVLLQTNQTGNSENSKIDLNVSDIPTGAYFVNIKTKNEIATRRLIISK